jgi:hypothetical protein
VVRSEKVERGGEGMEDKGPLYSKQIYIHEGRGER